MLLCIEFKTQGIFFDTLGTPLDWPEHLYLWICHARSQLVLCIGWPDWQLLLYLIQARENSEGCYVVKIKNKKSSNTVIVFFFVCEHLCNTMSKQEWSVPRIICVQNQHPRTKEFSHLRIEFLKSFNKRYIIEYTLKQGITTTRKETVLPFWM